MNFWIVQTLNSASFGGMLFMLSSGFSLILGLMRVPNLAHGAFFMLGAYFGYTLLQYQFDFFTAAILAAVGVGLIGVLLERSILQPLLGNPQAQVLVTLGLAFIIADACLLIWSGNPLPLAAPGFLSAPLRIGGLSFPAYRLAVFVLALVVALLLYILLERTKLGAMIRAGVDDMPMAQAVGIRVRRLFFFVFFLGSALAGLGGVVGGPILNAYPGLDSDMLPLALIVVILGGIGSLAGALVGSILVGFVYNFGIALAPDLAYFMLFLPMVIVLVIAPRGLFGRLSL